MESVLDNNQIKLRSSYLNKNYLENEDRITDIQLEQTPALDFFRIRGLSSFWEQEETINFDAIMTDLLNGFVAEDMTFVYVIIGTEEDIQLLIGVSSEYKEVLRTSLKSSYPFIDITEQTMGKCRRKSAHPIIRVGSLQDILPIKRPMIKSISRLKSSVGG